MRSTISAIAARSASASSRSRRSSAMVAHGSAAVSSRTALMPPSFAALAGIEFADLGVLHPPACLPEVVGHLQAQPGFGARAKALCQAYRHLDRDTGLLVDEIRQCLPRHTQAFRRLG